MIAIDFDRQARQKRLHDELLSYGLSLHAVNVLIRGLHSLTNAEELHSTTDDTLRSLKGCGVGTLKEIREQFPYRIETLQGCLSRPLDGTPFRVMRSMSHYEKDAYFEREYVDLGWSWIMTPRGRTFAMDSRLGLKQ